MRQHLHAAVAAADTIAVNQVWILQPPRASLSAAGTSTQEQLQCCVVCDLCSCVSLQDNAACESLDAAMDLLHLGGLVRTAGMSGYCPTCSCVAAASTPWLQLSQQRSVQLLHVLASVCAYANYAVLHAAMSTA